MQWQFPRIDQFVVFSTIERSLYHSAFGMPIDRLAFIHWGVNPAQPIPADRPLVAGDYVCAIGGNARDYATLLTAMRAVPEVKLVAVARPHNLAGLSPPPNVEIRANISLGEAMNILAFLCFMALPLAGAKCPAGT